MSKKNKGGKKVQQKAAPIVDAPAVEQEAPAAVETAKEPKNTPENKEKKPLNSKPAVEVVDMSKFMGQFSEGTRKTSAAGLDPNHRVDLLKMIHETFHEDPDAVRRTGMTQDAIDKINRVAAIGQIAVLAEEITIANNPFSLTMRPATIAMINELGAEIGLNVNTAALPAPDKDGNVTVSSTDLKVAPETKKQIKKEKELRESEIDLDVRNVKDEADLIKVLTWFLSQRKDFYDNIQKAISFYISYLTLKAESSENKEEELAKIKELSRVDILNAIINLVKTAPIVVNGIGSFLYNITVATKSPIPAFCSFRNTTVDKKTGLSSVDDQMIADLVRMLIVWHVNLKIAKTKEAIVRFEEDLKILNKDAKKNKEGIADVKSKIETMQKNIAHFEEAKEFVTMPSIETAHNLIEDYKAKKSEALKIFKSITDSFYSDIDLYNVNIKDMQYNVEQYAGIITNLFRSPLERFQEYSEANFIEMIAKKDDSNEKEEEKNA